jgi:hypothetical protein
MRFIDRNTDPKSHAGHEARIDRLEKRLTSTSLLFAAIGANATTVSDGSYTPCDFDEGTFYTNDEDTFTFDTWDSDASPVSFLGHAGLGIKTAGAYMMWFTLTMQTFTGNGFSATPNDVILSGENEGGLFAPSVFTAGDAHARGFAPVSGLGGPEWMIQWPIFAIAQENGDFVGTDDIDGQHAPVIVGALHNAGADMHCYPGLFVAKVDDDTFGF